MVSVGLSGHEFTVASGIRIDLSDDGCWIGSYIGQSDCRAAFSQYGLVEGKEGVEAREGCHD